MLRLKSLVLNRIRRIELSDAFCIILLWRKYILKFKRKKTFFNLSVKPLLKTWKRLYATLRFLGIFAMKRLHCIYILYTRFSFVARWMRKYVWLSVTDITNRNVTRSCSQHRFTQILKPAKALINHVLNHN